MDGPRNMGHGEIHHNITEFVLGGGLPWEARWARFPSDLYQTRQAVLTEESRYQSTQQCRVNYESQTLVEDRLRTVVPPISTTKAD